MDWGDVVFIGFGLTASLLTLMHPIAVALILALGAMMWALAREWGR